LQHPFTTISCPVSARRPHAVNLLAFTAIASAQPANELEAEIADLD
jgi:hypothetical protein